MPSSVDKKIGRGRILERDSGWAWVICAGVFFMLLLSLGYVRIFGVLFVAFQDEFSSSASLTASIMGVYAVVYSITSLLACNVGLERFSARQITMTGGLLVAVGVALDMFAYNVTFLLLTNGIIVGIGNAMIYGPAIVILGQYFDRRRTLAVSIAFCGACVGGIGLPPFVQFILDGYGVRGAMLIFGGVLLHVVPAAILLTPVTASDLVLDQCEQKMLEDDDVGKGELFDDDMLNVENVLDKKKLPEEGIIDSKAVCVSRLSDGQYDVPAFVHLTNSLHDLKQTGFYSNSLKSRYKSLPNNLHEYHQQSLFIKDPNATENIKSDIISQDDKTKQSIMSKIGNMMDTSLFKNRLFYAFIGFHLFGYAGIVTFPSFVPPIAKENGLSEVQGALLVSLHAGLDLCCRLTMGVIGDLGWFERHKIVATMFLLLGTVYQLVRLFNTFTLMILYVVVFGSFSGSFYSLHPSIAVDFFGREKFPKVFGYVQFFHGVVITACYPIMGGLRDLTGNYAASCHFLGAGLYVAALFLLIKPCLVPERKEIT